MGFVARIIQWRGVLCILCCLISLPHGAEPFTGTLTRTRRRATLETLASSDRNIIDNAPNREEESRSNIQTSRLSSLPAATAVSCLIFMLPLAAHAIDHPVDHGPLGVPIPVFDFRYFLSGGICVAASHGITTPIDVIKTRIQSEPDKFQGMSVPAATAVIVQESGAEVLLVGLGATVAGYSLEGALKFGMYESLKPTFVILTASQGAGYLVASVVAGACASLLLCPFEQTRIRLVTNPSYADGLVSALSRMIEEEGWLKVLFGGFPAMLSKQVPYTFFKQVSFDVIAVMSYSAAYNANLAPVAVKTEVTLAAAFLASILACIASHPGDLILTDTYKKRGDDATIPRFTDVVSEVYRSEGVPGFFSGISARFLHVGAIVTSQLVLYDLVKVFLGLPPTGTYL